MTTQPEPTQAQAIPQLPIRYLSVCSGMEAASVAWHPLGWQPVGFSEIEPFPCAILKHRFPKTPNYGSLTEYASWPLHPGSIDLLVGGTPCQSFSVAGLRKGMSDPRGNLALVFLGLADRLKPKWIVWENVPGVLSSNGGRDFGSFLGALVELGYGFAYRVLDAQYFGVPQRRRRVFVVACLGDDVAPAQVLFKPESLRWDSPSSRKKGKAPASDAQGGLKSSGCWWDGGQVSQTLDAVLQKGQTMPEKNRFPAVLQPICMSSGQSNATIAEDKAHTLTAAHETQTVATPITDSSFAQYQQGVGTVCATGTTTHCLTKSYHGSEDGTGRGTPIVIDRAAFNQGENAQYRPHIEQTDIMDTVISKGPHAVAYETPAVPLDGMNLLSRLGECGETHSMQDFTPGDPSFTLRKGGVQHGVLTPMAVRRLTPRECERLQGFPDDWSMIPWKGKPASECPDGPRYKCCGNSMAVPVMRWIGEQIAKYEAQKGSQP